MANPNNKFGMLMMYPSIENGKRDWYLSDNPNSDSRITRKAQISNGKICGNSTDGFYWCGDNGQIRIHVAPYVGKDDSKCACDQGKILERGYMETVADWRNFEISGEMRLKGAGNSLTLYGRGEYHYSSSKSADCNSCKGSSVKVNIDLKPARMRFAFETWHVNYNHTIYYSIPSSVLSAYQDNNLYDKWFRFIYVVYNTENNTVVNCELYLSKGPTSNEFVLIKKITVPGGVDWANGYDGAKACGCPKDDTPILWGGPITSYRWDDMDDSTAVKFRKLAIREIDRFGTFGNVGGPTPDGGAGTVGTKWKDIFSIGIRTLGDSCSGLPIGAPPFTLIYDCDTGDDIAELADDVAFQKRTRVAERVKNQNSVLFHTKPRKVEVNLKKVGTPGGNVTCAIWDEAGNEVVQLGQFNANSISTDYSTTQTFYNEAAPQSLLNGMEDEWSIGFEYLGTSNSNYVVARNDGNNPVEGGDSIYISRKTVGTEDNKWVEFTTRDLRMKVYI